MKIRFFSYISLSMYVHDLNLCYIFSRYDLKELVDKKRMSSEITIKSAERRDSALFTCLVTNAFGRDDMNIRLIVQGQILLYI